MATTWDDFLADLNARGMDFDPLQGRAVPTRSTFNVGPVPTGEGLVTLGPTTAAESAAQAEMTALERFAAQMAQMGGLLPRGLGGTRHRNLSTAGSDPAKITFTRDVNVRAGGDLQRQLDEGGPARYFHIPQTGTALPPELIDQTPIDGNGQAVVDAEAAAATAATQAVVDAEAAAAAQAVIDAKADADAQAQHDYWLANADWRRREEERIAAEERQRIARERELSLIQQSAGPDSIFNTGAPPPITTAPDSYFDPTDPVTSQLTVSALRGRGGGADPLPRFGGQPSRFGGQTQGFLGQRGGLLSNRMYQPAPITQRSWV